MALRFRSGSLFRAALAVLTAGTALLFTACASGDHRPPRPPFPVEDDPCASYCLVWVPPVYRDVPCVEPGCGKWRTEKVMKEKLDFIEVCKPGKYTQHCVPDQCRHENFVQVTPAKDEWKKVCCPCSCEECWQKVKIPPKYKVCKKCETDQGFTYCSFCPPEYDVVPCKTRVCEEKQVYCPAVPKVTYRKEVYAPGHWEWQKRYDCVVPKTCPEKKLCVSPAVECPTCPEPAPMAPPKKTCGCR
jgi:hypothetical protein